MSNTNNKRRLSLFEDIKSIGRDGRRIVGAFTDLTIINLDTGVNMSIANQFNSKVDDVDDIMDGVDNCHTKADAYEADMSTEGLTARQKANLKARMELYDDIGREGLTKARTLR